MEHTTSFTDAAEAGPSEYRSISPLAALALALGAASPAVLASPLLVIVPAAAIGTALLAERGIRRSAGGLAGAALARWGLALAAASLGAAAVRGPVRDELLRRQMEPAVERWLTLIAEDRAEEALSLVSGQGMMMMMPAREPGRDPLPEEEARTIALEHFRGDEAIRCVRQRKPPLTVQWDAAAAVPQFDGSRVTLAGDFAVSDGSNGPPCRLHVQCVRSFYGSGEQPWRIDRWQLRADEPPMAK
jgi:hypothetical protein